MRQTENALSWRNAEGFNLVSVLMGVALISLLVFLGSRSMVASKKAKNSVQAGDSYQQIASVLQDSLKEFIKTAVTGTAVPCGNATNYFNNHAFLRVDKNGWSATRSAVPSQVEGQAWNALFQSTLAANSFAGLSLNRCSNVVEGVNGRFHFCVRIQRDTTQPKESLLQSPLAFAEVSIQLNDLASGSNLTCAAYLDPVRSSAGATVDYILLWVFQNGTQLELKKRSGTFYVNK